MKVDKEWLKNPGSPTAPRGELKIWILTEGGTNKELVPVRFAYLSEFERLEAEDEGTLFAQKRGPGLVDKDRLQMYTRAFVLARALRQADDVDVQLFKAAKTASAGEVALRSMPVKTARDAYDAWWLWMESEFPDEGVTEEESEEATRQAEGE